MKKILDVLLFAFILLALFLHSGCRNRQIKQSKNQYEQAMTLFKAKEFNGAKIILDSVIEHSDKKHEIYLKAERLLEQIKISEQKQNLVFLDSLMFEKESQIKTLKRFFVADSIEGLATRLVHFRQKEQNSFNRSFIKPNLDENGTFFLSSQYCGVSSVEHTQIKVYFDGNAVLSEKIDYDDNLNRRYGDAAYKWEIIQFKDGRDNGIVDFIVQNFDKPLKVQFIGKTSLFIVMESYDKEAIRDSYEMSFLIREIARIKREKENSLKIIKELE